MLCRLAAILANVKNPSSAWIKGEWVELSRVEQVINSHYVSVLERERLKDLQSSGLSISGSRRRWVIHRQ